MIHHVLLTVKTCLPDKILDCPNRREAQTMVIGVSQEKHQPSRQLGFGILLETVSEWF